MSLILFYQKEKQKLDAKVTSVCFSEKEFVFARAVEKNLLSSTAKLSKSVNSSIICIH